MIIIIIILIIMMMMMMVMIIIIMHKRSGMSLYLRSTKKLMLALSTTNQSES